MRLRARSVVVPLWAKCHYFLSKISLHIIRVLGNSKHRQTIHLSIFWIKPMPLQVPKTMNPNWMLIIMFGGENEQSTSKPWDYIRSMTYRFTQSFVFCVVFCRPLFVLFSLFLLAILLSVLRFTHSVYLIGIFKLSFLKPNACKPLCSENQALDPRILNVCFSSQYTMEDSMNQTILKPEIW